MRALVLEFNPAKYALLRAAGRIAPDLYTSRLSLLALRDVPEPRLRGTHWARLKPRLAGVCGSDLAAIELKSSMTLTPFSSFPCVLGHEIVADVEEAPLAGAADGKRLAAGERVVVEPLLPCDVRDLPACERCAVGHDAQCYNVAHGSVSPGMFLGYTKDLPGGWSERIVAHERMLHRVPDALSDEEAVLVEPLAVGFRAVMQNPPEPGSRVLVLGGGMIALAVLAAFDHLGVKAEVVHASPNGFAAQAARELGAEPFVLGKIGFDEVVTRSTGARPYRPLLGRDVFQGGFDMVFDCVGSARSVEDSLRATRAGGTMVLLGGAGVLEVDWTLVWARELTVRGVLGYGWETWGGERKRTFDVVLETLAERRSPAVRRLVTHKHDLRDHREALRANRDRNATGAIKTVFEMR